MTSYPAPPKIEKQDDYSAEAIEQRNRFVSEVTGADMSNIAGGLGVETLKGNIENIFGFAQIPIGLAGPILLNGDHARGEFFIPMATTEGTLVASYNRGMKAISQCGGANVEVTKDEIFSSLTFVTASPKAAADLKGFIDSSQSEIRQVVESATRHGKYLRSECKIFGSRLILSLMYNPADAMGINMITSASFLVARMISEKNNNLEFFLPSGLQGDKKATFYNYTRGRGRSVRAEVLIKADVLDQTLKCSAQAIFPYYLNNVETSHLVGSHGFNMHIGNGITALGLATGQDVAYVSESASGHLVVEKKGDDLQFSLEIPSLYIGTVGGGTGLPTAKPCLEMMGCTGPGSALKLAEIFAGVCLAGEISVLAAIAGYKFVAAHDNLGRNRPKD